jgi:ribosomal protein L37AE/L43A
MDTQTNIERYQANRISEVVRRKPHFELVIAGEDDCQDCGKPATVRIPMYPWGPATLCSDCRRQY